MKRLFFKKVILMSAFCMIMAGSFAQTQIFQKEDVNVNLGIGFGNYWITTGYSTVLPPVSVSVDYALRDDWGPGVFGIGGYVGTSIFRSRYTNPFTGDKYGYNYFNLLVAVQATYHYTFVDNLDTYGGVRLGFNANIASEYGDDTGVNTDPLGGKPLHDVFAGAKYYFTDGFAAFAEVGYGVAYFTIGATFKF